MGRAPARTSAAKTAANTIARPSLLAKIDIRATIDCRKLYCPEIENASAAPSIIAAACRHNYVRAVRRRIRSSFRGKDQGNNLRQAYLLVREHALHGRPLRGSIGQTAPGR